MCPSRQCPPSAHFRGPEDWPSMLSITSAKQNSKTTHHVQKAREPAAFQHLRGILPFDKSVSAGRRQSSLCPFIFYLLLFHFPFCFVVTLLPLELRLDRRDQARQNSKDYALLAFLLLFCRMNILAVLLASIVRVMPLLPRSRRQDSYLHPPSLIAFTSKSKYGCS